MSIYSVKQQRNIVLILTILLGLFLAYSLKDIFTAILGAIILYTIFRPMYLHLVKKNNWKRSLSSLLIIIISFIIIILPFFALSWMVVNKIGYYRQQPDEIQKLLEHITKLVGIDIQKSEIIESAIKNMENWALGSFPSVVNALFGIFLLITIMYFILYFMFVEHEKFEKIILRYMPFREHNTLLFAEELKNITYSNVLGQGLIAVTQGGLVCVGFLIFNINDPIFWGVVSTILSFIPVIGAPLVFIPAGLIEISYGNNLNGYGIIIWGLVLVTNIDNVMRLLIAKRIANTHPVITIIGVIIGIPLFGVLGLVFGPLLISYFLLLISIYESRLGKASNAQDILKHKTKEHAEEN